MFCFPGGLPPPPSEIRTTDGQYASYWNAFLLLVLFLQAIALEPGQYFEEGEHIPPFEEILEDVERRRERDRILNESQFRARGRGRGRTRGRGQTCGRGQTRGHGQTRGLAQTEVVPELLGDIPLACPTRGRGRRIKVTLKQKEGIVAPISQRFGLFLFLTLLRVPLY